MTIPRWLRWLLVLIAVPILLAVALQIAVVVGIPRALNVRPDRLQIHYDLMWMSAPGVIEVRDLSIRSQSRKDQWYLTADAVTATVDLQALLERRFIADDVVGRGVTFRYRQRVDAPDDNFVGPPSPFWVQTTSDAEPPIPGLTNPPDPVPELLDKALKRPWTIKLSNVVIDGIEELWFGDYRFVGDGHASGGFSLLGKADFVIKDTRLELTDGELHLGDAVVANAMTSTIDLLIDDMDPANERGRDVFSHFTSRATLHASVQDLKFLDFYLANAPWLRLSGGAGDLDVDVSIVEGEVQSGSFLTADAHNLVAQIYSYAGTGDALVKTEIGVDEKGAPETRMSLDFRDYVISRGGEPRPLVKGHGLKVSARSPDTDLAQPFTRLDAVLEIPDSSIPDIAVYATYLPENVGFELQEGAGRIHARLQGSTEGNVGSGNAVLTGKRVRAKLDDVRILGDFEVQARVPRASLDDFTFNISGSRMKLSNVALQVGDSRRAKEWSDGWWATLDVPTGKVAMGAPVFLDATLVVNLRDSVPFITMFAERKPLPGWVRGILDVQDVTGGARIRIGDDLIHVPDFQIAGGGFEVLLHLKRQLSRNNGALFARFGKLSVGMGMNGAEREIHVLNAKKWYADQAESPR